MLRNARRAGKKLKIPNRFARYQRNRTRGVGGLMGREQWSEGKDSSLESGVGSQGRDSSRKSGKGQWSEGKIEKRNSRPG